MTKTTREEEKEFNNNVFIGSIFITIMLILISSSMIGIYFDNRITSLEKEIDSMPHYECWNETIEEVWTIDDVYSYNCYVFQGWEHCPGEPFPYKHVCMNETCYVEIVKELCQLNKHDALKGESE